MEFKKVTRRTPTNASSPTPPPREASPASASPKKRPKPSRRTTIGIAALILACGFVIAAVVQRTALTQKEPKKEESVEVLENLEYQTILPENETISTLGGWRKISPPGKPAVYAYADKIGEVAITVSQQPLPENFIGDADRRVTEIAKAYSATTELNIDGTKAYLGTSAKGPQSVIFTKNNLLIMIKSQQQIPNDAWANYLKSLN